ncbi:prenyltransferase/squalene oxidase repeat-containing protein [Stieleria varia]|uniref:Sporulenol synthase n=1 Tax=Stieleria varia TaxID=2528005 RepID=A0A5C6B3H8_9BACT|nr:prenyltransferase/squalene oxidase repeat-containing protein [Stieleria varia]TWU05929.1 Sporulenol synthase [Stieleria varia]
MTPRTDPPEKTRDIVEIRVRARETLDQLRTELISQRGEDDHWTGQLSASALSTATAVSAIAAVMRHQSGEDWMRELVRRGMQYLCGEQNQDGGFGDTDRSHSNIATSYLVLAADSLARQVLGDSAGLHADQRDDLQRYLRDAGEIAGLKARYGKDKTFVVPILTNMAIAGLVDWKLVSALPFEAAVFPQSWYRFLRMPVVSYAIPALVAIGQARHFLGPRSWFPIRAMRSASVSRTMAVLERMQPESGGYLEATPLTSFVLMSLAATGRGDHPVALNALRFLQDSVAEDGSWPIDTNLATWVTSLSVHALACDPLDDGSWFSQSLLRWHLDCQHRVRHPFTGASPGGWGWTDLSGAVPDGDDTPGAILALRVMKRWSDTSHHAQIDSAIAMGSRWLLQLQNGDGGWPTFCRGWGKLPFDRSSTDLTAHAIRALSDQNHQFDGPIRKGQRYLDRMQQPDGAWLPLWFGNQDQSDEINPVYGTAKVLLSGAASPEKLHLGVKFLLETQNGDGGWGGGVSVSEKLRVLLKERPEFSELQIPDHLTSSVEETALAVDALCSVVLHRRDASEHAFVGQMAVDCDSRAVQASRSGVTSPEVESAAVLQQHRQLGGYDETDSLTAAIIGGVEFLLQSVRDGRHRIAWPIGFYFAKLWYHEKSYPLIFTVAALGKFLRATTDEHDPQWPR